MPELRQDPPRRRRSPPPVDRRPPPPPRAPGPRRGPPRHIVTVHDVFDDAGTPCLVARYMTGGSLADRLGRAPAGRLEPQEVIAAGREIANALAHAHAHGVVHRDVKSENVWIDAEG